MKNSIYNYLWVICLDCALGVFCVGNRLSVVTMIRPVYRYIFHFYFQCAILCGPRDCCVEQVSQGLKTSCVILGGIPISAQISMGIDWHPLKSAQFCCCFVKSQS